MPHSTSALVGRILTAASTRRPRADVYGLTVVPLEVGSSPTRPASQLLWQELDPPTPTALAANNPTRHEVIVSLGDRVTGGMSDRAVTASAMLPEGATMLVPVEPLSPRWWYGGMPSPAGGLPAALTALLVLAISDSPGLRSIARTALWEAYRQPTSSAAVHGSGSWLVLHGRTLFAAHLVAPVDLPAPGASPTQEPAAMSLMRLALAGTTPGYVVRVVSRHAGLTEVWLVHASLDLPDAILASTR